MITKLTDAQIARFPEFVKKWTDIGLSTTPANRPEAENGIKLAYDIAGLKPPQRIVWCGSPLSQGLTRAIIFGLKDNSVWASVGASVRDSVWASVGDSVWASVWDSVGDSVRDSFWDSFWDSVGDSVNQSGYGQHDANWLAYYEYFRVACELGEQTQKLIGLWVVAKNAGWFLPHEHICWISERHNILHRNNQGRLHRDQGPALAYPDGFSIYALNGVRMKPAHVLTPAEQITPETVLNETNVEIRRELLRKIGIERFLSVCKHKRLEKIGNYELLCIELTPEIREAKYLRMLNPSIGVWHLEAVAPECRTVQQAINWRASQTETWEPESLT